MNKEKLIKKILDNSKVIAEPGRWIYIRFKDVKEIIQSELDEDNWILCSERLPESEDLYQVTIRYENFAGVYKVTRMARFDKNRGWEIYGPRPVILNEIITAWQPLPQPYKGE